MRNNVLRPDIPNIIRAPSLSAHSVKHQNNVILTNIITLVRVRRQLSQLFQLVQAWVTLPPAILIVIVNTDIPLPVSAVPMVRAIGAALRQNVSVRTERPNARHVRGILMTATAMCPLRVAVAVAATPELHHWVTDMRGLRILIKRKQQQTKTLQGQIKQHIRKSGGFKHPPPFFRVDERESSKPRPHGSVVMIDSGFIF